MKSSILVLLLLIAPASAGGRDPFIEEDVFTFAFPDLEGRTVSSSDPEFRGKVLLVDLWGTWCPPCVSEIPTCVDLQQRFGDQGLTIVAIAFESSDEGSEARRAEVGPQARTRAGRAARGGDGTQRRLRRISRSCSPD
jgi:thiol-disulfide isomerase/thioredoxin